MARGTLPGDYVIPDRGIAFGADLQDHNFTAAEELLGRKLDWHRRHYAGGFDTPSGLFPWASDQAISEYKADIAAGATPVVVWAATSPDFPVCTKGGSYSNTAVVNGAQGLDRVVADEFKAKLTASAGRLADLDVPIMFILWQEPNIPAMGGYHVYQTKAGEPRGMGFQRYRAAARRVDQTFAAAGFDKRWMVWCPTLFVPSGDSEADVLATYFPECTIVGFDAYRDKSKLAGTCDFVYDFAVAEGKPVIVGEWGDYPASMPTNLAAALAALKSTRYQAIIGFMAWAIAGISDNRFDATPATAAAWQKFGADDFTHHPPTSQAITTQPQVGMIFFENASRATALSHPTFAMVAKEGVDHTAHEGTSKPSLPDYCALIAGSYLFSQGHFGGSPVGKDGAFAVGNSSANNLLDQLKAAGFTWRAYEEGVSGPSGYTAWGPAGTGGLHVARHAPASFFHSTAPKPQVGAPIGRFDFDRLVADIAAKSLPDFFAITPNLINDGHNQGLSPADQWLAGKKAGFPGIGALIAAMRPGGILVITFDNVPVPDTSSPITGTGRVYLVCVGPGVAATTDGTATNHFGLLRAIQQHFGLPEFTSGVDPHYTGATVVHLP